MVGPPINRALSVRHRPCCLVVPTYYCHDDALSVVYLIRRRQLWVVWLMAGPPIQALSVRCTAWLKPFGLAPKFSTSCLPIKRAWGKHLIPGAKERRRRRLGPRWGAAARQEVLRLGGRPRTTDRDIMRVMLMRRFPQRSATLLLSLAVGAAAIYPSGHFGYVKKLNSKNFEEVVEKEVDEGRTIFVRWIHSTS